MFRAYISLPEGSVPAYNSKTLELFVMEFQYPFLNLIFGFKRKQDEGDTEELSSMYKRLLAIAWPAALEGLLLSLMNSFDTMMVGKLGSAAIASVGLCAQPRMIMLLVSQSLCVGTTAVIARRKGEGDQEAALSTLKQSLVIMLGLGVLMVLIGYFLAKPLLLLAGAGDDTLEGAMTYFQIQALFFVMNNITLCICAAMRGIGKTKITMIVNMTANIVNVFLNYCLIGVHFGFPALGIKGAAIATVTGTTVSALLALSVILKKGGYLSILPFSGFSFDKNTLSSLITVGSGTIAESVFMRVGFLINGKLIAGVSTAAYATNQIVMQLSSLTFTMGDGVASACTSLIGQSLGSEKPEKAISYTKIGQRISLVMSVILIVFIFTFRRIIPCWFTDEADIISAASICFIVILFGTYPQNMRVMIAGCLRGAGDVKYVAMVSLISVTILRPLITWFFCYPMNQMFPNLMLGFIGAWISFDLDAICRWLLLQVRINKGDWVKIKL